MPAKKQRTTAPYELLYWPTIPGRGEFIRLAFEATGTPYKDICNADRAQTKQLTDLISPESSIEKGVFFAPPLLRIPDYHDDEEEQEEDNTATGNEEAQALVIHQTPNILIYLSDKLGLSGGSSDAAKAKARQIMLTALDLNNEAHDTHHPVAVMEYYEDQKDEALRRARDFRENRVTKFFGYFERCLKANEGKGEGRFFVGEKLSVADVAVWQVLDGLKFAFPKEIAAREKEFPLLYGTFYPAFKEQAGIKEYLASDRRLEYSSGIFRHYPELDRQE